MYHFFTAPENIRDRDIYLNGADYNHIKNVLRMSPGTVLSVTDSSGGAEYRCHIEGYTDSQVHCRLDFIKEPDVELPVEVTLYQGLPKSDKMDFIIQKSVELGVSRIVPVRCGRSILKLDGKRAAARLSHWRGIAEAAAKQSRRAKIPEVDDILDMRDAIKEAADSSRPALIPYELAGDFSRTREILDSIVENANVSVFIGPEGGFTEEEASLAARSGILPITLGRRILRTETAALVVLSWLIYRFEP